MDTACAKLELDFIFSNLIVIIRYSGLALNKLSTFNLRKCKYGRDIGGLPGVLHPVLPPAVVHSVSPYSRVVNPATFNP